MIDRKLNFFFLLLLYVAFSCVIIRANGVSQGGVSQHGPKDWNILVLTRSWPPAACIFFEKPNCTTPSDVRSWVIHGLWPTLNGTEGPNYCNYSSPFDVNKVQVLKNRLDLNWPSINPKESNKDIWEHEWEKHGRCGTTLPALGNELDYFNVTLGLHNRYNLSQFLAEGGVVPSYDRAYRPEDVLKVLQQKLGTWPTIACVRDKENERYYLEQIEVCLAKSFQPTDCACSVAGSSTSRHTVHDLKFRSETLINGWITGASKPESCIHDCGSQMYYKPMLSGKLSSHV